jgi:DNA repair exonuclease SbcCD nuclease subunit
MRILLFTDVHWSATSSITTKFGTKYTARLEMLINSMNWVNEVALEQNCSLMICAGDMMDKSTCSDIELTALKDIRWNHLPCYFLCGNHESSAADLKFSTVKCLEAENHIIIDRPAAKKCDNDKTELCFLPYVVECDRKPLVEYFGEKLGKRIIISHNDIAGINYGPIVSKTGFDLTDIEASTDIYLNGHIHNSEFVTEKVLNLGSLSAHNFSNDSFLYRYGCWLLDTETLKLEFLENPCAYNFYKLQIDQESDICCLDQLKNNAVLSIKCEQSLVEVVKQKLSTLDNIIESRIILTRNYGAAAESNCVELDLTVDHLTRFVECCKLNIENSSLLEEELAEICK